MSVSGLDPQEFDLTDLRRAWEHGILVYCLFLERDFGFCRKKSPSLKPFLVS